MCLVFFPLPPIFLDKVSLCSSRLHLLSDRIAGLLYHTQLRTLGYFFSQALLTYFFCGVTVQVGGLRTRPPCTPYCRSHKSVGEPGQAWEFHTDCLKRLIASWPRRCSWAGCHLPPAAPRLYPDCWSLSSSLFEKIAMGWDREALNPLHRSLPWIWDLQ